jgi:hypothetical protein
MAKEKKPKVKKERQKKYEQKFTIEGDFGDVFKVVKKNKEDNQNKKP